MTRSCFVSAGGRLMCALSAVMALSGLACHGGGDPPTRADDPVEHVATSLTAMSRSGWVATASATGGTNVAANAIDSNPSTRWSPGVNQASGQFFQVDMLSPRTFVELSLATAPFPTDYPRAFQVSVSNDGTNFGSPIATGTGAATPTTIAFAPQTARYVRVTLTAATGSSWSIADFNVFTTTLARTGWSAVASSTSGTNAAVNALDGSATTKWTSAGAQTGQSFTVNMAARQTFTQITLDSGTSTNNFPRSYSVSVSNDGVAFGSAVATGTATSSPVVINLPAQFAQFVKITAGTNAAAWTIAELNIDGQPAAQTTLPRSGWTATATSTSSTTTPAGALDGNTGTRWSSAGAQTGQAFTVDMLTFRTFNQITLDAGTTSTNFPRAYSVFVSNDGVTFGGAVASGTASTALVTINVPTQTARYVRISQTATNSTTWSIQELNVLGPVVAQGGWSATASSTGGTDLAANAFDGMASTRWSSAEPQTNGQTFQVDLGAAQTFSQLTLDAGTSTGGYPRGYSVSVSQDGVTFGMPVATGTGSGQVVTINFPTTTARAVRIMQTGSAANVWSIHELTVSRIAQPCDTATCNASDVCHTPGTCDPNTGLCSSPSRPDGQACNDGNLCTLGETCQQGVCKQAPATTCVTGNSVTFYQSFENGTTVDIAGGGPKTPLVGPGAIVEAPGLFGKGIDGSTTFDIEYADVTGTSINLTKPGSFSYWFKNESNVGAEPLSFIAIDSHANMKLVMSGGAAVLSLDFEYAEAPPGAAINGTPGMAGLAVGQWHLLVVNWGFNQVGISIDGGPVAITAANWLTQNHAFGPFTGSFVAVGGSMYPGVGDEFIIMNRPMTDAEIQWYWAQRSSGGPNVVNPAIAHFNAVPTACNPFDDLNPCTADSCNPAAGVTRTPVADGTSCSDANMCDGAETCQAGVCTAGTPVACADACHQPGVCNPPTGTCTQGHPIDKIGCNIALNPVNVVDMGNGTFTAIFGYASTATKPFQLTTNTVSIDGVVQPNYEPAPPAFLRPGNNPGAYLPTFTAGHTITWTLDGQPLTASASSTPLTPTAFGSGGQKVTIGGIPIIVTPDLAPYKSPPSTEPPVSDEPQVGPVFNGVIAGSLSVGPTGAAIYTVPIQIPPGVAGMAPNLSLVYNSQGGEGLAGRGWELGGLSSIHRCPKTRPQDGYARPVMMDALGAPDEHNEDGICLDGTRLFKRNGYYEPEAKDFSSVRLKADTTNGGEYFVVQTKSGQKRYYGSRSQSRVQGQLEGPGGPVQDPSASPQTAAWLLDRVMDEWGNYYLLQYNHDGGPSEFRSNGVRVTQIEYTGHAGIPEIAPFNKVLFEYEERPDVRRARFRDLVIPKSARLKSIETPAGKYFLGYRPAPTQVDAIMLPSLLKQISYCTAAGLDALRNCATPLDQQVTPLVFDWEGGDYHWEAKPTYKLPVSIRQDAGSQIVDLDGDGRPDILQAKEGTTRTAWRNAGDKWEPAPSTWKLPADLVKSDGTTPNGLFVDLDGDRILDFIATKETHDVETCTTVGDVRQCELTSQTFQPAVFLNRLRTSGVWQFSPTLSTTIPINATRPGDNMQQLYLSPHDPNASFSSLAWFFEDGNLPSTIDFIYDVNGDGIGDWVRVIPTKTHPLVLLNTRTSTTSTERGWSLQPEAPSIYDLHPPGMGAQSLNDYFAQDVNDDGLPDYVQRVPTSGSPPASLRVAINTGSPLADNNTVWKWGSISSALLLDPKSRDYIGGLSAPPFSGDIDGDGRSDHLFGQYAIGITYATGFGDVSPGWLTSTSSVTDLYTNALNDFRPPPMRSLGNDLVDLNADGLADWAQEREQDAVGQLLINTGTTLRDLFDRQSWPDFGPVPEPSMPMVASRIRLEQAAFLDLDGDGVVDVASPSAAYMNRFKPPVITAFPNGIASKTDVSYAVITTAAAQAMPTTGEPQPIYSDAGTPVPGTTRLATPLRVVSSTSADSGIGARSHTNYRYANLRAGADGRGPQGFGQVTVVGPGDAATNAKSTTTVTTFAQAYPYTGRPLSVEVSNQGLLTTTETTYCETPDGTNCVGPTGYGDGGPPLASLFVRPKTVKSTTYLRTSTVPEPTAVEQIVTTTESVHDAVGNPTLVTVTATSNGGGGSYQTETHTVFGAPGSSEEAFGKPTLTTVKSRRRDDNTLPDVVHTTGFDYTHVTFSDPIDGSTVERLVLEKQRVEPGAGVQDGLERHTAYEHDAFGNVITTTVCASDFNACVPGATSPSAIPFRTTFVSYDPSVFQPGFSGIPPAVGALEYDTPGRFPVRTTVRVGTLDLVSYSAYDPRFGVLRQQTDVNGNHTVHSYDDKGRETSVTEYFGTNASRTTSIDRYVTYGDVLRANLVTRTRPPTGATVWTYIDALDRTILVRRRSFKGGITQVATEYDRLGRVERVSKPYVTGDTPLWTTTFYDPLSRPQVVADELGRVDTSQAALVSTTTTIYSGSSVSMTQTVGGAQRSRRETKNTLGKVIAIVDPYSKEMTYAYDGAGNLIQTDDHSGHLVKIHYDLRGRKDQSVDPDLGTWTYRYDGFDDLVRQTDAKMQATLMTYDELGRVLTRTDAAGGIAEWVYDVSPVGPGRGKLAAVISAPDPRMKGGCFIPGATHTDGNRAGKYFHYSTGGEVQEVFECTDGQTFQTSYEYDAAGRQRKVTYPVVNDTRFSAVYNYTSTGFLYYVADGADGTVVWKATNRNAVGDVTDEVLGNGVETLSDRSAATGWLLASTSVAHAIDEVGVQQWSYRYDEVGNVRNRQRTTGDVASVSSETFEYDLVDRVISSRVVVAPGYDVKEDFAYDTAGIGNLTQKGNRTYTYGGCGAGPHAVCSVGGSSSFAYDGNGNMLEGMDRSVVYNTTNKVDHIDSHPAVSRGNDRGVAYFIYDATGNRVVSSVAASSTAVQSRTLYVGLGATGRSVYERTTTGSDVEHVQFVYGAGGSALALRVIRQGSAATAQPMMRYNHVDHLGSITAVSDEVGRVVTAAAGGPSAGELGYGPWGARRNPDGTASEPASFNLPIGRRGFTGHETIPDVGLVNMNGRVYDPALGRFLSPDPNIQFVANLQSYNRYSYVMNNPLRYSDPTGYFINHGFDILVGVGMAGSAALCGPYAGACALGAMIGYAAYSAASAHYDHGASWGQSVGMAYMGVVVGLITYGAGGALIQQGVSTMTVAAGSVTLGGVMSTVMSGGGWGGLGENVLMGAATSALTAALSAALTGPQVSQRDVDEAQGGGGSGEDALEKRVGRTNGPRGGYPPGSYADAPATRGPFNEPYDDIRQAAAAAEEGYNLLSTARHKEFGGLLYELDGDHYATAGVAGGAAGVDPAGAASFLPEGATVEGYWHTHGAYDSRLDFSRFDWNERFSGADIRYHLPTGIQGEILRGYVGTPAGMLYEFTPGPGVNDLNVRPTQIGGYGWLGGYGFSHP